MMLVIFGLYILLVWLLFWKFQLVAWGWVSGFVAVFLGAVVFVVLLIMFNYLTPSGTFVVTSRVVDIAPDISGQVIAIPVRPDQPVQAGATLFEIDRAPLQSRLDQLEASLAQAKQQAERVKADYEQATAMVERLTRQLDRQRPDEAQRSAGRNVPTRFKLQDTQMRTEALQSQLQAAKAAQSSAKQAMETQIDSLDTSAAGIQVQIENTRRELGQTTIRAPGDGFVPAMALAIGDRVLQGRPVMSFFIRDDVILLGMLSTSGPQNIRPGTTVKLAFEGHRGRVYHATIVELPERAQEQGGPAAGIRPVASTKARRAIISIPSDIDRKQLRLGTPGSAWVLADDAGGAALVTSVVVWVASYMPNL